MQTAGVSSLWEVSRSFALRSPLLDLRPQKALSTWNLGLSPPVADHAQGRRETIEHIRHLMGNLVKSHQTQKTIENSPLFDLVAQLWGCANMSR